MIRFDLGHAGLHSFRHIDAVTSTSVHRFYLTSLWNDVVGLVSVNTRPCSAGELIESANACSHRILSHSVWHVAVKTPVARA